MTHPTPGPRPGAAPGTGHIDLDALDQEVTQLLGADCEGSEEADIFEQVHRLITDALDKA